MFMGHMHSRLHTEHQHGGNINNTLPWINFRALFNTHQYVQIRQFFPSTKAPASSSHPQRGSSYIWSPHAPWASRLRCNNIYRIKCNIEDNGEECIEIFLKFHPCTRIGIKPTATSVECRGPANEASGRIFLLGCTTWMEHAIERVCRMSSGKSIVV